MFIHPMMPRTRTTHSKINEDLGRPDDPGTKALLEFLGKALNR
jgi:hypothetical protein